MILEWWKNKRQYHHNSSVQIASVSLRLGGSDYSLQDIPQTLPFIRARLKGPPHLPNMHQQSFAEPPHDCNESASLGPNMIYDYDTATKDYTKQLVERSTDVWQGRVVKDWVYKKENDCTAQSHPRNTEYGEGTRSSWPTSSVCAYGDDGDDRVRHAT